MRPRALVVLGRGDWRRTNLTCPINSRLQKNYRQDRRRKMATEFLRSSPAPRRKPCGEVRLHLPELGSRWFSSHWKWLALRLHPGSAIPQV